MVQCQGGTRIAGRTGGERLPHVTAHTYAHGLCRCQPSRISHLLAVIYRRRHVRGRRQLVWQVERLRSKAQAWSK